MSDSVSDFIPFDDTKSAGRVNFNAITSGDYLTNENYKMLRTNLLFCGSENKAIVLTSARENEGKSTITAELSQSMAEAGKKTVMIDADMRKSVLLHKNFKAAEFFGLSEFLSGQAELSQVLYHTQNPDFDIIFSGHFPPNPVELLGTEKFDRLLKTLRTRYDYILIDSPPLGSVIDAAVIAARCDGAIIVISSGKVTYNEVLRVKEQIEKSKCKILGAVLNNTDAKSSKYYKEYYKSYRYHEDFDDNR